MVSNVTFSHISTLKHLFWSERNRWTQVFSQEFVSNMIVEHIMNCRSLPWYEQNNWNKRFQSEWFNTMLTFSTVTNCGHFTGRKKGNWTERLSKVFILTSFSIVLLKCSPNVTRKCNSGRKTSLNIFIVNAVVYYLISCNPLISSEKVWNRIMVIFSHF